MSTILDKASLIFDSRLQAWKTGKLFPVKPVVKDLTGDFFEFTRGGVATYTDKDGILRTAQAGQPRFQFENGVNKGLWIEPSATNLFQRSEEFNDIYWTKSNATITPNATISPNGVNSDADLFLDNSENNVHNVQSPAISFTAGDRYSVSFFAKKNTLSNVYIATSSELLFGPDVYTNFDLSEGTVAVTGSSVITAGILPHANGWYRCFASYEVQTSGSYSIRIGLATGSAEASAVYSGAGQGIYLWRAQLETGSVATSSIKTEGATVTRPADVATITNASDLIGQEQGTVLLEFERRVNHDTLTILATIAGSNSSIGILDAPLLGSPNWSRLSIRIGVASSNNYTPIQGINLATGRNKLGLVYTIGATASFKLFLNGDLVGSSTGGESPINFDNFRLTALDGTLSLNGGMTTSILFKQALSDTEVQNWTTL